MNVEELPVRAALHCLRGSDGERAPDEADQKRPRREPGYPERLPLVNLLLSVDKAIATGA